MSRWFQCLQIDLKDDANVNERIDWLENGKLVYVNVL
jgi:hypothetical protein